MVLIFMSQFDSKKGATWHCIVGRNFGSFVTHGKDMVYRVAADTEPVLTVWRQKPSTSSISTLATLRFYCSRPNEWIIFSGMESRQELPLHQCSSEPGNAVAAW